MLIDGFNRKVNYLRISVTERCNFRCVYCMPEKPFTWVPKEKIMSFEETFKFVKIVIDKGVNKIRITGGEPLLREDLHKFVSMIHDYNNNIDLALTTNGYLLSKYAKQLKHAGLNRINISLDSLKPDIANKIAQKNVLTKVLQGIQLADEIGFKIKLNCVVMKDINFNEIIDLLEFAIKKNYTIRFIEFMENNFAKTNVKGVKSFDVLNAISKKYKFQKIQRLDASPAQYFKLDNGYQFGIIEPHNDDFCENCNRVRLTAEGFLIPCLYFENALSIKESVLENNTAKTNQIIQNILKNKPEKNKWSTHENKTSERAFYTTGG